MCLEMLESLDSGPFNNCQLSIGSELNQCMSMAVDVKAKSTRDLPGIYIWYGVCIGEDMTDHSLMNYGNDELE